jgi:inositol 2-dehydrogenase
MNRRPRLGLIGLGRLGAFHAENLVTRVARAELAVICDVDGARAGTLGAQLGVPWTDSIDEVVGDPSLDGIVIATPTATHVDLVERAAQARKHIFCEKPIALTLDDTLRAISAAQTADVLLQVGFHRRFDPDFERAKARIAAGDVGRPHLLRVSHRDMHAPEPGTYLHNDGDLFLDAMIHDFDTARWLVGEVEEVTTHATAVVDPQFARDGDADHAVVVLRFENGALGIIDNSRSAGYGYECSAELIGSKATLRIGMERSGGLRWLTAGKATGDCARDHTERHPVAYVRELEGFAAAIFDRPRSYVTPQDALAAFEISLAATRSHDQRRSVRVGCADERSSAVVRDTRPGVEVG